MSPLKPGEVGHGEGGRCLRAARRCAATDSAVAQCRRGPGIRQAGNCSATCEGWVVVAVEAPSP
eukprot:9406731-Alexandrium_andersonii.AAC.1